MSKFSCISLIPLCICIIFLLQACDTVPSEEELTRAKDYASKGNFSGAISSLDSLLREEPKNIDALLDRGFYRSKLGEYKLAIADYSKVICCIDQKNTLAFYNRSLVYSSIGKKDNALKDLNLAIATKGGSVVWVEDTKTSAYSNPYDVPMKELRFERGMLLYNMDSLKTAFDDFTFSIQDNYLPEEGYYYRGIIYLSYKNKEKGCADLNFASSLGNIYADTVLSNYCR